MSKNKRRKCFYCRGWFIPDARVKGQQKSCGKSECSKKRKQQAQKRWSRKNPEYFKGRYENTLKWLEAHPGYLKVYRKKHPEYVKKNRFKQKQRRMLNQLKQSVKKGVDIQDTMVSRLVDIVEDKLRSTYVDIQDATKTQLIVPVYVKDSLVPYSMEIDIQDDIDIPILSRYTWITRAQISSLRTYDAKGINKNFKHRKYELSKEIFNQSRAGP